MSIPSGHIITVGGLSIIDRLQDAGLQNPKVPTETVYETGNDLVVGKVLMEANFSFQLTSWDTSCDLMALLTGKHGTLEHGASYEDSAGTKYHWENCEFINLACPWASDTGTEGGDIASGVIIPAFYPTSLAYKFGVTANAEQSCTLEGGAYYMSEAYPIEEFYETTEAVANLEIKTKEVARQYAIGGFGGEEYRHVFGVLVNGIIQQEGVDYEEKKLAPRVYVLKEAHEAKVGEIISYEGVAYRVIKALTATEAEELAGKPAAEPTIFEPIGKVEGGSQVTIIKFLYELPDMTRIRFCYLSNKHHAIPQSAHATTAVKPAAVRGRDIKILLGAAGEHELHGVQEFTLTASHKGQVQRELGFQDPIGYDVTGLDTMGSFTINPKEEQFLYKALEELMGIPRDEIYGYINEFPVPLTAVIYNPRKPTEVLKSIHVTDAIFQTPGTTVKANSVLSLPISWESLSGTFEEIKGELP